LARESNIYTKTEDEIKHSNLIKNLSWVPVLCEKSLSANETRNPIYLQPRKKREEF